MPRRDAQGAKVSELIAITDGSSRLRFVSRSFADYFGAPAEQWHGLEFAPGNLAAGINAPARFSTIAAGVHGEQRIDWEETLLDSGERLYVGAPDGLGAGGGEKAPQGACEDRPNDATKHPEARDNAPLRMLATMSHEMRTPLNGILGMTGLLLDSGLNANQRSYAEAVRESGAALLALINDILDYSKLDAGKLELEDAAFDLNALVQSVCELLSPKAADKGIELCAYVEPSAPRRLIGDEGRLRQVLINLVGNAVKFTDRGGVAIEAATHDGDGFMTLEVAIRDTGVGIPLAAQPQIFDEFQQADSHKERRSQGTGLGLAISRRLVRAMGGDITFASVPGQGSVFYFTAKLRAGGERSPVVKIDSGPVVVATRSATLARILDLHLSSLGVKSVSIVSDAASAAAALSEQPDATLLSDLTVVDGGGEHLAEAARRSLVLVAATERSAIDRLRNAGFDGYLIKPIRQSTLMRELARGPHIAATEAELETDRPNEPRPQQRADARRMRILLAEDNQINAVLATALIRRAGHHVDVAINGVAALDALGRNPYDLIFMDMHMPEMDGLEASRRVRALPTASSKTPIVALTANAMASDRMKCIAAGMDDFLPKPFDPADLNAMLDKWLPGAEPKKAAS
jgi:signal transduction histidine kinase/CheY-like chemotaxis protein